MDELNLAAARLAREAADEFTRADAGPAALRRRRARARRTARASISPDVNDPGFRDVTLRRAGGGLHGAARALVEGGVDLLLVETIFDTLNAKAAIFAIEELFEETRRAPAGHDLGHDHRRLGPHALGPDGRGVLELGAPREAALRSGFNCALGAKQLRPYVEELARIADVYVSAHPNAGLPNAIGTGYDETPEETAGLLREFARARLRSTSPAAAAARRPTHIRAIAGRGARPSRRARCRKSSRALRLSGLEPLNIGDDSLFVNVGERTNVTGSKAFARLILAGRLPRRRSRSRASRSRTARR